MQSIEKVLKLQVKAIAFPFRRIVIPLSPRPSHEQISPEVVVPSSEACTLYKHNFSHDILMFDDIGDLILVGVTRTSSKTKHPFSMK